MIEIIVAIIAILFYAYVVSTFLSYVSLVLNIIIITALYFVITKDLGHEDNHKYYIFALVPSALFFIFSSTGLIEPIVRLANKLLISEATLTALLVYLFANGIAFSYEYYKFKREKHS